MEDPLGYQNDQQMHGRNERGAAGCDSRLTPNSMLRRRISAEADQEAEAEQDRE
jgi:hypothetical protein